MALRVLLADESTTIKKVMQLALQDFAVEVKAVHVGVDVIEVAKTYKPDLIFVDVLLQKRNGYEVSSDIKKDAALKEIPVVLMWSSFMDLDDLQADRSGADRRLEKPFDVENLRQLVLELVPKTRDQRLAHFLKFPESVTEPLKEEEAKKTTPPPLPPRPAPPQAQAPAPSQTAKAPTPKVAESPKAATKAGFVINLDDTAAAPKPVATPAPKVESKPVTKKPEAKPEPKVEEKSSNWNMESFDDLGKFAEGEEGGFLSTSEDDEESYQELRLTNTPAAAKKHVEMPIDTSAGDDEEPWSHQDLSRFKIELPPVSIENEEIDLEDNHDLAPMTSVRPRSQPNRAAETVFANANLTQGFGSGDEPKVDHSSFEAADDELENISLEIDELTSEPEEEFKPLQFEQTNANDEYLRSFAHAESQIPEGIPETLEPMNYPSAAGPASTGESYYNRSSGPRAQIPQLTTEQIEQIVRAQVREQSREIIETVVRRLVPDLATELIRAEIRRLLDESPR